MSDALEPKRAYFEVGQKKVIAGVIEWPGWCRAGRDEDAALQALVEYGPRYARVMEAAGISFQAPSQTAAFEVIERLPGNTTSDFGAPDVQPSEDAEPVDDAELRRLQNILKACWAALDRAEQAAAGKELRKGPRGGGRETEGVIDHVVDAESSYTSRLGGKLPNKAEHAQMDNATEYRRQLILDILARSVNGEYPSQGLRGGARWTPRYFVRRAAWHILDHAWEIEDRIL